MSLVVDIRSIFSREWYITWHDLLMIHKDHAVPGLVLVNWYQLVSGRREGTGGADTLSGGAITSSALDGVIEPRQELQEGGCALAFLMLFRSLRM